MRKVFALFLIVLVLFNSVGYYGLLSFLRYRSSAQLLERLENQAEPEAEALTVRIPLSIPYMPDRTDFDVVRGDLEHNGDYYGAARQKYERDTLTVTYYKDNRLSAIHESFRDFVKGVTDTPESQPKGKAIPTIIKDFMVEAIGLSPESIGWVQQVEIHETADRCRPPHDSILLPPPSVA